MNQPIAFESALSNESRWEFGSVMQVKVGVAVRRNQLSTWSAFLSGLPEPGLWEHLTRAASREARHVRINLLSSGFQQQDFAP